MFQTTASPVESQESGIDACLRILAPLIAIIENMATYLPRIICLKRGQLSSIGGVRLNIMTESSQIGRRDPGKRFKVCFPRFSMASR